MNQRDYFGQRHGYMYYRGGAFSEFILSVIKRLTGRDFEDLDTVYELGAGMGRFSHAFVNRFRNVYLIEPSHAYADVLREVFPQANSIVRESSSEQFFEEDRTADGKAACFCFHVLHHLTFDQRRSIFDSIHKLKIEAVFVDPNPLNPLIPFQVLLHPAMKWAEERGYLKLRRRVLLNELAQAGLSCTQHFYLCFLPPGIANFALKLKLAKLLLKIEAFSNLLPFFAAYQMVYCKPEPTFARP